MKILVLGASGGVGQWLTRLALERGHDVTAVVRPSSALGVQPSAALRVLRGDPLDAALLADALAGRDAVASCLGLRRAGKSPWAPLRSPPDLTERAMRTLVPLMERANVRRLVAVSAGGVGDSAEQLTTPVRWLVGSGNVAVAYRDLERMERVLAESTLDWLAVRPVTLADGPPTGRARPVPRYRLTSTIRRSDVAAWMLEALARTEGGDRTVLLGTG